MGKVQSKKFLIFSRQNFTSVNTRTCFEILLCMLSNSNHTNFLVQFGNRFAFVRISPYGIAFLTLFEKPKFT